jgi:diadenosine tetraphosphate (Ap4A) HIT family hydrolase
VHSGKHWNVLLNKDQSFLGRCIVYLKSRRTDDLMSLTPAERSELWNDIMPTLVNGLMLAFKPDRINYAHLANAIHHVHWHVVPRYEREPVRHFAKHVFVDRKVGANYLNVPPLYPDHTTMRMIVKHLKKHLPHRRPVG